MVIVTSENNQELVALTVWLRQTLNCPEGDPRPTQGASGRTSLFIGVLLVSVLTLLKGRAVC